jgi:hypothetical protein
VNVVSKAGRSHRGSRRPDMAIGSAASFITRKAPTY